MNELTKLIDTLKDNKKVIEFKTLEKAVNENEELKTQLLELFELQQEMVQLKHIQKYQMYEIVKKDYEEKRDKLENDPLVSSFLELQEEIEYLLLQITSIIEDELNLDI